MNVSFTAEQRLLAETAEALARRLGPSATRDLDSIGGGKGGTATGGGKGGKGGPAGVEGWGLLADAGLIGIRRPEAVGGGAGSATELMIVVEALARHACPVPFLGVVLGAELLAAAGAPDDLLADIVAGTRRLPVALDPTWRGVARYGTPGALVWDAAGADAAIMLDAGGGLVVVDSEGEKVTGADLTREMVRLPAAPRARPGPLGRALGKGEWQQWEALALALLAADLLGIMDGALTSAVDYSRERVQFDTPIGAFQAVQHLCADSFVLTEGARSATWYAAWAIGRLDPGPALVAARTAKAYATEAAVEVTQTVIQVHGGVAITWDTLPHVYLRRGLVSRRAFGDESAQFDAIADERLGGAA